jgi:hypothetical protein
MTKVQAGREENWGFAGWQMQRFVQVCTGCKPTATPLSSRLQMKVTRQGHKDQHKPSTAAETVCSPAVTLCTARFNIRQFYVLPTQCVYVFCVDLRTNSDYFPTQH